MLCIRPHLLFLMPSQACCENLPKEANCQEAEDFQDLGPKHPIPGHRQGNQGALQVGKCFLLGLWSAPGWSWCGFHAGSCCWIVKVMRFCFLCGSKGAFY